MDRLQSRMGTPNLRKAATLLAACSILCLACSNASDASTMFVKRPTTKRTTTTTTTSTAPAQAAAAGYNTETFATASNFTTNTVDMGLTNGAGYQWYFFNFFGYATSSALTTLNSDGSVTLASFSSGSPYTDMSSAAAIATAPYYRGTAFGGGAYFEAVLAFNASSVNEVGGWPAWWTMSLEHLAGLSTEKWTGQVAGYEHFVEPDIFEADLGSAYPNAYGGNTHDWYGLWGSSACPSYCNVQLPFTTVVRPVPTTTKFSQYHKYGLLWIPATATKKGSLTYYFDGVQVGPKTNYSEFTNQPPVPTTATPWTFGVIDKQHMVLILGTGASTPMHVYSVKVWQASAANNMHN